MRPAGGGGVGTYVGVGIAVGEDGTVFGVVVAVDVGAGTSPLSSVGVGGANVVDTGIDVIVGSPVGVFDKIGVDVNVSYTANINVGVGEGTPLSAELQAVSVTITTKKQSVRQRIILQ
jgi:hypothetical protein